jgi:hypothetical protein
MSEDRKLSPRLDSWKAIAEYLGRDVRTVRRWERTLGLPVRRVPGRRGHSVFADVSEIENWLHTAPTAAGPSPPAAAEGNASAESQRPRRAWWWVAVPAALVAVVLTAVAWRAILRQDAPAAALQFQVTPSAVVATGNDGRERWRYQFPPNERVSLSGEPKAAVLTNGQPGVYVLVGGRVGISDNATHSGQLLRIGTGRLDRLFSLDDEFRYPANQYGPPWAMTAFRVFDRGAKPMIAVAAHHWEWWPSVVTVLDADFQRRGMFVNAGWVESLEWVSADRLIVGGFSNAQDAAMVALLDPGALNGQSPTEAGSPFDCASCGRDAALRYIVLPRSELNRVTASAFNRAEVALTGDRVMVRTIEVEEKGHDLVDAVYEFSPALDLARASFSDRYWDLHQALEAQGKLHHTRAECPDRDGPRGIQVWEPTTGWRTLPASRKP